MFHDSVNAMERLPAPRSSWFPGRCPFVAFLVVSAALLLASAPLMWSQADIPVSMVVSVQAKHGTEFPTIYREDVRLFQEHQRMRVTEWSPFEQEQAGLELFLAVDDSTDPVIGLQFDDLRKFINQQPPTTEIAIGYMHFGMVDIVQEFTSDHARAGKSLRLPMASGGIASPYLALKDLMRHWPETGKRRVIFMISSGIDALQPGPNNMYLDQAIETAQRTGTQIYSIYAGPAGQLGETFAQFSWGQNNLLQLAEETGGDAYFQGLRTPISFGPYLDQFAERLNHQFKLTFLADAREGAGLRRIRLETEVPNAELAGPSRVYVPER